MRRTLLLLSAVSLAALMGGCAASRAPVMEFQNRGLIDANERLQRELGTLKVQLADSEEVTVRLRSMVSDLSAPPDRPQPAFSVDIERQIIYTGSFRIDAEDVDAAIERTAKLAADSGGYVQKQTNEAITIRVPAAKFREAVAAVEDLGVVRDKSIDAQDVTEEYMDLNLRLDARQAYLDQLKKMLAEAKDMAVMLEIQKELSRTVEDIERLKGRIRYLSSQVQFSTISIAFGKLTGRGTASFGLPFPWLERLGLSNLLGN